MCDECAVRTVDLHFTYPDGTRALRGVNFTARRGEKVAIIGSNGSGKSTFLFHLNGILFPTKGKVFINGEEITKRNLDNIRQTVGIVFQDPDDQLFAPTVWDDVAFGPGNMGLSKSEVEERVNNTLRMLNIEQLKDRSPDNLSGGQKRLVSIAGVLAMNPEIIALDEPTSNLDSRSSSTVMRLLHNLSARMKITLIMATHDIDAVPLFAERVYVMSEGRIIAEGTPEDVFSDVEAIRNSHLRLPRVAHMMEILHKKDGMPTGNPYPLTIGEARRRLREICGLRN